ncbi:translation protein [Tilletiaria anomala UBC 951]|uniref:Large ribosomal subunit protein uL3m n=1 Tax=Tilletiaria anomala (strain ATCC 24038 / CBS 436.72 / UBC 951) TaxID=1037660 RepID=A0A066WFN5_TILAU|nr:translation protein [Tilletiaria anomala UBC 951]KDN51323.1 translation protein [Tilletiaria anomala UBC 951]
MRRFAASSCCRQALLHQQAASASTSASSPAAYSRLTGQWRAVSTIATAEAGAARASSAYLLPSSRPWPAAASAWRPPQQHRQARFLSTSSASSATPSSDVGPEGISAAASSESAPGATEPVSSTDTAASPEQQQERKPWSPTSQRVGLIGIKMGMISYFLPSGICVPAAVVQVQHNQVMQQISFDPVAHAHKKGTTPSAIRGASIQPYLALQVFSGASSPEEARRSRNRIKGTLKEFRVTPDALVPPKTQLSVLHFVPGQQVDVQGTTKGKGFQGAMKRHGFKGLRASHGVSISHRSHGSTGQHQDPGRVFPGKKMAGRMGGRGSTLHNLTVLRIDTSKSLIFLKGNIPGPNGSEVYLTDAKRSLIGKARNAVNKGKLRDGSLAKGDENGSAYLPDGIEDLPFPAATKEMEKDMPAVVEVTQL